MYAARNLIRQKHANRTMLALFGSDDQPSMVIVDSTYLHRKNRRSWLLTLPDTELDASPGHNRRYTSGTGRPRSRIRSPITGLQAGDDLVILRSPGTIDHRPDRISCIFNLSTSKEDDPGVTQLSEDQVYFCVEALVAYEDDGDSIMIARLDRAVSATQASPSIRISGTPTPECRFSDIIFTVSGSSAIAV